MGSSFKSHGRVGNRTGKNPVWTHFIEDPEDPNYVICQLCDIIITLGIGRIRTLSGARRHLKHKHWKEYKALYGDLEDLGEEPEPRKANPVWTHFEEDPE